jgi:hypothetical protein
LPVLATIGARLVSLDAARFVGRSQELACLEALLADSPPAQIAIVNGPAGVGKSTLIRELARRASAGGRMTLHLDGRDLTPTAAALAGALASCGEVSAPLILLDSWERMTALDDAMRRDLLPSLPSDSRIVIATRRRPDPRWFTGGWENLVIDLRLMPLDEVESEALLVARGLSDREQITKFVDWARGSPLALVLAAQAGSMRNGLAAPEDPLTLIEDSLRGMVDAEPQGEERDVLAVASLAHVTTPELLAAALPGIDADRAYAWLRAHPGAEAWRDGVVLHDLVARVLRADLRQRSPELERKLRRRLVDALYARAMEGGYLRFARDLQHLIQDPAVRWGYSWDALGRYRIDTPKRGDIEAIAAHSGPAGRTWLRTAERYFASAADRVCVVRDARGEPCGYAITVTPANAPEFAREDPVLGPRLRDARERYPDGAAVLCRQAADLTGGRSSPVIAMLGMAGVLTSGLDNPAAAYMPVVEGDVAGEEFSRAIGAIPLAHLETRLGGVRLGCHLLDCGQGGLIGFQRAVVYRELGLPPPDTQPAITVEDVREALRLYATAAPPPVGPLAPDEGSPSERAAQLRARLDAAVEGAFGSSAHEQRLHQVLHRAYLDPSPTHELAAFELHLSRSAYFRQLRTAVERVAVQLGARLPRA